MLDIGPNSCSVQALYFAMIAKWQSIIFHMTDKRYFSQDVLSEEKYALRDCDIIWAWRLHLHFCPRSWAHELSDLVPLLQHPLSLTSSNIPYKTRWRFCCLIGLLSKGYSYGSNKMHAYEWNAIIMKYRLPEAPKEGEIRDK